MKKKLFTSVAPLLLLVTAVFAISYLTMNVTVDEPIEVLGDTELDIYPGESYEIALSIKNYANATHNVKLKLDEKANEDDVIYTYSFDPDVLSVDAFGSNESTLTMDIKHDSPIGELIYTIAGERQA